MNRPNRVKPKTIRKQPDRSAAVKPAASPCSDTTDARTIVTKMFGPEISPRVFPVIGRQKAECDSSVEACCWPQARYDTEGHRRWH